jgi:hypothetical protein
MAKCQTCRGTGRIWVSSYAVVARLPAIFVHEVTNASYSGEIVVCPDCGGSGIEHCCEGLREQPEKND